MNKLFPTVFGFIILIIISISWYNSQSKNEVSPKEEALIKSEVDKLIEESKKSYEEKQIQDWSIRYYVDEFGDPTTSKYVSAFIQNGSFSNSAVTKRKLYSSIIVDDDDISIELSEYRIGEYVKGNDEQYIVKIKQNDEEPVAFVGTIKSSIDRITFSLKDGLDIIKILKKGGRILFYIEEKLTYSGVPSKYNFAIYDCSKFKDVYLEAFPNSLLNW
tara:strand:- start:1019 stop:1669 length:651 start_codon:yes stop_codon:yes gene_type:complete